jgi:pimeloyl-ACP methyl ester carboxylesterase
MPFTDLREYKNTANYIKLGNHNIAYWTHLVNHNRGTEPVPSVLFVHGFPSAAWDWHSQWQFLQNEFKHNINLIAFDLLGFGLSDKPAPYSYSLIEQALIAEQLLTHLNINNCHIFAHDYGDSVAQALLYKFEKKQLSFDIASICYLNGGLFSESHRPLLTQKLLKSPLGPFMSKFMTKGSLKKSFAKIFGPATPPTTNDVDAIWTLINYNDGRLALHYLLNYIDERRIYRNAWVEAMQKSHVKQLFVNGVHDPISGKHMLEQFKSLIPNAEAIGVQLGHYPQLENPELINTLYLQFINSIVAE